MRFLYIRVSLLPSDATRGVKPSGYVDPDGIITHNCSLPRWERIINSHWNVLPSALCRRWVYIETISILIAVRYWWNPTWIRVNGGEECTEYADGYCLVSRMSSDFSGHWPLVAFSVLCYKKTTCGKCSVLHSLCNHIAHMLIILSQYRIRLAVLNFTHWQCLSIFNKTATFSSRMHINKRHDAIILIKCVVSQQVHSSTQPASMRDILHI